MRYVLEGSIQTSGNRVRVTAQLIDTATNAHVGSERYDRALDDIFDVQNEITQKIAAALGGPYGTLAVADAENAKRKPPASLQAYDYYVLASELQIGAPQTKEIALEAEELLKKAIDLDPRFARAYGRLAGANYGLANIDPGQEGPAALFEKAKATLLQAIALDPTDARAYALLGTENFKCRSPSPPRGRRGLCKGQKPASGGVDADLRGYFDSIPHDRLMALVAGSISDGPVLSLIDGFLRQEIMTESALDPLLSLHRLGRMAASRRPGLR